MKYLLDEDEYKQLKGKHGLKVIEQKRLIADLCRRIANTEEWEPATGAKCIRDHKCRLGSYCSGCPALGDCTFPNKRLAK